MGEPAGIGGEIALQAWRRLHADSAYSFLALDDPARLAGIAKSLGLEVPVQAIDRPEAAPDLFRDALPVLPVRLKRRSHPGRPDPENAGAVIESIDRAVALVRAGAAAAIVTNPIHKETLYAAGFHHPGHTEYLAELAGGVRVEMMLACPGLRVVPMTIHLPLREALDLVTRDTIVGCARRTAAALQSDFGIESPRLVVAGLNPHAGENGTIGREDVEIIAPAIAELRAEGLRITGPHPADSLFHAAARATYDAAICMYHDQALIPIKTIDFFNGVNITLGLPFVRTSPDHGTAFGLAGTGQANAASLVAALQAAAEIAGRRAARSSGG
jgi:4-hydroxythreonine-4-phosphate dehydrogenase